MTQNNPWRASQPWGSGSGDDLLAAFRWGEIRWIKYQRVLGRLPYVQGKPPGSVDKWLRDWAPFEVLCDHDDDDPRFPHPFDFEAAQDRFFEVWQLSTLQFIDAGEARQIRGALEAGLRSAMG